MPGPDEFLEDLAALTAKYGLRIDGCGCCGSPSLQRADADPMDWPTHLNLTYSAETQRYTVAPE